MLLDKNIKEKNQKKKVQVYIVRKAKNQVAQKNIIQMIIKSFMNSMKMTVLAKRGK